MASSDSIIPIVDMLLLYLGFLEKWGFIKETKRRTIYVPKKYHTPENIGDKMQLDVKYVPNECKTSAIIDYDRFYQYTIIDEASRKISLSISRKNSS